MIDAADINNLIGALSLIAALVGLYLSQNRGPVLEAFFLHSSEMLIPNSETKVHVHAAVIRNVGSGPAKNIHVAHEFLPEIVGINIHPHYPFERISEKSGKGEIVFERLGKNQQVTLTYLYPSDIYWHQIGLRVYSEEGDAKIFPINFVRAVPRWLNNVALYLMFVGFGVTIFIFLKLLVKLIFCC